MKECEYHNGENPECPMCWEQNSQPFPSSSCSAELEATSEKIRRGEPVGIMEAMAVIKYQSQKPKRKFRRSREAMILDMLLLPFGLIRSLVMQGFPETLEELKRLPKTYSRGWREAKWFFLPNDQDEKSPPKKD